MRSGRLSWRYGVIGVGLLLALAATTTFAIPSFLHSFFHDPHPLSHVALTRVARSDLNAVLRTGGRVESSSATSIECELENLRVSVQGYGMYASGASTILSVIPDGTFVKKGDVLCVLDASEYEEMLRQQLINVERARADHQQSLLVLDVARMAVDEYRDGLRVRTLQDLEGRIALTQSDLERAKDRLEWTRKMLDKGYLPKSQLTNEEFALRKLELSLKQGRTSLQLFQEFSAPKYLRILESDVRAAEATENYQSRRVQRFEERLANFQKQVERCTIRAPHDGYVIYANEDMRQIRIEPGLEVRQKQDLFFLPDLNQLVVDAVLHETVVKDVKPGMTARVKIEAMGDRVVVGKVESIAQLPLRNRWSDLKYFVSRIRLVEVPEGLRPGMSAEVEVDTMERDDVIVVPSEVVALEDGHNYCYVASEDRLEKREISVGQTSRDLLEVTEGLTEGEQVVSDPYSIEGSPLTRLVEPMRRLEEHFAEKAADFGKEGLGGE